MAVEKSGGAAASSSSTAAMDRFQKIVLSWDYLRLVAESKVHVPPTPTPSRPPHHP
jgi:senataxin